MSAQRAGVVTQLRIICVDSILQYVWTVYYNMCTVYYNMCMYTMICVLYTIIYVYCIL